MVELVVSAIRPAQLLAGKVVGIGLLGLAQMALLAGVGVGVALAVGIDLPGAAWGTLAATLAWFVLGYVLYGLAFAVAGSVVSRQEDLQYSQLPVALLIFGGYGLAMAQIDKVESTLVQVLSLVPPLQPMLIPLRIGFGEITAWEVALAVLLMVAAVGALAALAVRLYAGSVLRFGSRVKLADAWRSTAGS